MKNLRGLFFSTFLALLICACSIQIYDLQPIIRMTETPDRRSYSPTAFVARTKGPVTQRVTNTPPLHIAPTPITVESPVNILEVAMIDGAAGWGIGKMPGSVDKIILRTEDGGNKWRNVTPPQAVYDNMGRDMEVSAKFLDQARAWVLFWETNNWSPQNGVSVWRTTDGGETWQGTNLPITGYTIHHFKDASINFADGQIGWVMVSLGGSADRNYYGLYTTYDGGASWSVAVSSETANLPAKGLKNGAVFRNALEGWVSGVSTRDEPGAVLWRTFDGGNSWGQQFLPVPEIEGVPADLLSDPEITCSLSVPRFVDFQYQYAWATLNCRGGSLTEPLSLLYWSYDTLSSWKAFKLPAYNGNAAFYGIDLGWFIKTASAGDSHNYEIMTTMNGGENWTVIAKTMWDIAPSFITGSVGYGVADFNDQPYLMKTLSGGYSWEQIQAHVIP